jgi:hypothetical protein
MIMWISAGLGKVLGSVSKLQPTGVLDHHKLNSINYHSDKKCSKLLDTRMQDPRQTNGDNMDSVRHESSRLSEGHLKDKIYELEANRIKILRDMYGGVN